MNFLFIPCQQGNHAACARTAAKVDVCTCTCHRSAIATGPAAAEFTSGDVVWLAALDSGGHPHFAKRTVTHAHEGYVLLDEPPPGRAERLASPNELGTSQKDALQKLAKVLEREASDFEGRARHLRARASLAARLAEVAR